MMSLTVSAPVAVSLASDLKNDPDDNPSNKSAFRLSTFVVELTIRGAVPLDTSDLRTLPRTSP